MPKAESGWLPDFVIVGAMKAGTTTLFQWLGAQPEVALPSTKEPQFFSDDDNYARGLHWYASLFPSTGALTGDASVAYTAFDRAAVAASRMAESLGSARLVYVVRDPVARLRSHYRHELLRGREKRSLAEALRHPGNPYVGDSRYWSCLSPYLDHFPRTQVLVVPFEELFAPEDADGWDTVTAHLGLSPRPRPDAAYNVSENKAEFTPTMLRLWESGMLRRKPPVPRFVRRAVRPLLLREGARRKIDLSESEAPIADDLVAVLQDETTQLERWLGRSLWSA